MFSKRQSNRVRQILGLEALADSNVIKVTHVQMISDKALSNKYAVMSLLETMKNDAVAFINDKIRQIENV